MKSSIAEQKRGGREKKSMKLETVLLEQALVVSTLIKADSTVTALCNSCHSKKAAAHS